MKPLPLSVLCLLTLGVSLPAHGCDKGQGHATFDDLKFHAERGDAFAQVKLGDVYNYGQRVRQNYKEAVKWYRRSADQGHADAHASLGVMHDGGYGVPQDYEKAVHCYRIAAEHRDPLSQYFLGVSFMNGEGVPGNNVRAYRWFDIAAAQGLADAKHYRAIVGKHMSPDQIAEAKQLARQ